MQKKRMPWWKKIVLLICLLILAFVGFLAWLAFSPQHLPPLVLESNPMENFAEAASKVEALKALAAPDVLPECHATVFDHGKKTERVYVLMHGLTNCPAQFTEFAKLLHATGANVLIPRLPYHGYIEDLDYRQQEMTAQGMLDGAGFAVDLAHGYGEKITLVGLSVNGTTVAWLAQMRDDVDTAMIIAPFFAPAGVPSRWVAPLSRVITRLPNRLIWWDPVAQTDIDRPAHAYARFATHPIAAVMQLGRDVFKRAESGVPPKAKRIIFVTSEADIAINLDLVDELAADWEKSAPGRMTHHIFPAAANIPHDCIDPAQTGADLAFVYPRLLSWLTGEPLD